MMARGKPTRTYAGVDAELAQSAGRRSGGVGWWSGRHGVEAVMVVMSFDARRTAQWFPSCPLASSGWGLPYPGAVARIAGGRCPG